jgi:2'-5' RNA ligase
MSDVVIVAIPAQDDYVWKISSEKVPHLTLLYLGSNVKNIERLTEFVGHVVDTTFNGKFYLTVDRRGELGDKSADVLFFDKEYGVKNLQEFRRYLLHDPDIRSAYNSVEQFPTFTPHLTLGYPETPAKPDKRDYTEFYGVKFDRIAIWTEDFNGPEFVLKNDTDDAVSPMYMSSIGADFLSHYGIKGMKWGVSKGQAASVGSAASEAVTLRGGKTQTSDIIKKVRKAGGVRNIGDKELQSLLNRMDMESRYSKLETQHKKHRIKGRAATLKLLGEVGKIALPIILGGAAARAATSPGAYRTYATVGRTAIDLGRQAIGS